MRIKSDAMHSLFGNVASFFLLRQRDIVVGYWNGPKYICLSFDCDYPQDMEACGPVARVLQAEKIPASFAIPGRIARAFSRVMRDLLRNGYEMLNHTFSHPSNFGALTERSMRAEIDDYQDYMKDTYDYLSKGFRTPHGLRKISPRLFNILREKEMYDSSLLGYSMSRLDVVVEVPLSPCPEHSLMAFDSYHHFRLPLFSSSEKKMLHLWISLLEANTFVNIFMDPMDLVTEPRLQLLERMIAEGKKRGFTFVQMAELVYKYGNPQR